MSKLLDPLPTCAVDEAMITQESVSTKSDLRSISHLDYTSTTSIIQRNRESHHWLEDACQMSQKLPSKERGSYMDGWDRKARCPTSKLLELFVTSWSTSF